MLTTKLTRKHRNLWGRFGRIIRNYTLDNGKIIRQKKIDGHAHLFAIMENENDIADLMDRLEQYELTSDAFTWGSRIDVSNGSTPDPDDENNNNEENEQN